MNQPEQDPLDAPEVRELQRATDEMIRWVDRRRLRWVIGVTLALVILVVLAGISIAVFSNINRIESSAQQDCGSGNLPNGYIRLVLERTPAPRYRRLKLPTPADLLPILDCEATAATGHPVRLRADVERRYLRVLARKRLPIVRDGEVIGSEPLPAPRRPAR